MSASEVEVRDAIANPLEYVDIFIPIYRYKNSNHWYCRETCGTLADAASVMDGFQQIAEIKIIHVVEKFKIDESDAQ